MKLINKYINSDEVKIHYIHNNVVSNKIPLLICPGLSESSKDYIDIINTLDDRKVVALSFRGRGESLSKLNEYTLVNHVNDIELVVKDLNLNNFCIMGHSRGVSYILSYAIKNNKKLKGLIIGEYPPEHKKMPRGWAKESINFYNNHCDVISITYEVLKGIEKDSNQVYFKDELNKINCKTLILKGELEETLLNDDDINVYLDNINSKNINVVRFKNAGHDIKSDDFNSFINELRRFLELVDNNS